MSIFHKTKKEDVTEETTIKSMLNFFSWIQETSKTIVLVTFGIFIFMDLASLIITVVAYLQTGELNYIDTIISESNQTFRDVVGGYIIKAGVENVSKGICIVMERYFAYLNKKDNINAPTKMDTEDFSDDILNNTSIDESDDPEKPSNMSDDGTESDEVPIVSNPFSNIKLNDSTKGDNNENNN